MRASTSLTPLLVILAPALAQNVPFEISSLALSGTGCPDGTYDLDIMAAGGFIFHAFDVTLGSLNDDEDGDGNGADAAPPLSCRASLGLAVNHGWRVTLQEVAVTGSAGLDVGVVATVETAAFWEGDEESVTADEQVLLGSAVGVGFPNPFTANPSYDDQKSRCGPLDAVLNIDVTVWLGREEGEGEGVVSVEFMGLRIGAEECEGAGGENENDEEGEMEEDEEDADDAGC